MANIFALGLLKGASQGFLDFRERQRQEEERKRQEEREDKIREEEKQWAVWQTEFQTEAQRGNLLFEAGLEQEAAREAREAQEAQLKALRERYPNAIIAPQAFSVQIPRGAPTTPLLTSVANIPNASKEGYAFAYKNKRGEDQLFPTFDPDIIKDKAERANFFRAQISRISPEELEYHLNRHEAFKRGDPGLSGVDFIAQYKNTLSTYREELRQAQTYKEGDKIYIRSPNLDFGLDRLPPDVAERFATTVFPEIFGLAVDDIKKTFKLPPNAPLTYDQYSQNFVIDENVIKNSNWAVIPDNNSKTGHSYDPVIFSQAREIAGYAGMKVANVIAYAGTAPDPTKRLNNILLAKAVFGNTMIKNTEGFYDALVAPAYTQAVLPLIRNMDAKDAISFIRHTVPVEEESPVTSFQVNEGKYRPIYSSTLRDIMGVTTAEARAKATSANQALITLQAMRDLQDQYDAKAGKIGQIRVSIAGFADLLEAGLTVIESLGRTGNPENDALRNEHASEVRDFAQRIRKGENLEAQALFNMLSRHASYYIAGAVQGGAEGRAISDFDVRQNSDAMQLEKLFSFDNGAKINLEYLIDQMDRTSAINTQYMSPRNDADIQAANIFEQMTGSIPKDIKLFMAKIPRRNPTAPAPSPAPSQAQTGPGIGVTIGNIRTLVPTPNLPQ